MSDIKDDFWDIEKLLPKKKSTLSSFSTRAQTVDFTVNGEKARTSEQNKITLLDSQSEAKIETYEVENSFIKSVTITRFPDKYDFYGNFRKAALLYYDFKTPECDFAPFYSYMPQYSQLNSQQKGFYFFWRDCVRKKKYIKTDYSYFYLYVYEILNLPDKIPPQQGLDTLIDLWRSYRRELPNIDGYMTLLVQDYCLVWRLGSPVEKISDFIHEVIGFTELKEFYLADVRNMGEVGVRVMLAHLSDYDWRRGRYAGGDNREIYSRHLLGAMGALINKLWDNGDIINSQKITTRISRAAFRNSLCTHSVKCRLDIDYIPLIRAEGITRSVTEAVKYTENKLRALLGAKSRLAVRNLPDDYKNVIDSYFDVIFEKVNRERRMAAIPEYEKLYDKESTEMSFSGADEIERISWVTTARLVSDEGMSEFVEKYNEPIPELNKETEEPCESSNVCDSAEDAYGLSAEEIAFISAVSAGDVRDAERIAKSLGVFADTLTERINEAFSDGFGDVIIEGIAPNLSIIEDYKEDVEKWLSKIMK